MPDALIATFSQTGTTTQVAERIATGLRAAGWQVDLHDITPGAVPDLNGYDLLGIGTPTYFFRPPFVVQDFVHALPKLEGKPSFVFVLCGVHQGACGNQIRARLRAKGAKDVGYFCCFGADYWMGYVKRGILFSPDSPTEGELAAAEAFGGTIAKRCDSTASGIDPYDGPTPFMYAIERTSVIRPFARLLYSKLFRADDNCNGCGVCIKKCPVGNITATVDGKPRWHSNCILCVTCELACPKEAIYSPFDCALFAPFMSYNIQKGIKMGHPYARVEHTRGKTHRV